MKGFLAGKFLNIDSYKAFIPEKININWRLDDMELIKLLSEAERALGKLDMFSDYVPNINLFIAMHVAKEATLSSKIEGTKTSIEEVISDAADIKEEHRNDWVEVNNYIKALNESIESLATVPISTRLIKKAHKTLLSGVRGDQKMPGEFRRSQNWIGGASLIDAVFIPPPHYYVDEYMYDLENFLHNDSIYFPALLKIALAHYQFETIHPFLDGNGRVGRLLITLYLVEKGLLKKPILYLSDFFEKNRTHYYNNLMKVRLENDINQWYKFFLVGIITTANNGIATFDKILQLQREIDATLHVLNNRKKNASILINYMFEHPVINAQHAQWATGLSYPTIYKLLDDLIRLRLVTEKTGARRNRTFIFKAYVSLF